ncbi:MAG: class I SAM-dependent methyltransferase [Acidimicrobiales bacterium]
MEGYRPSSYGDVFADVYDEWYRDLPHTDRCADAIAELAAGGPVLELGVGTGRLALAMAARGVWVTGLDASAAMLAKLRAKPLSDQVRCVRADMAQLPFTARSFAVVLVAFNTLFNLPDAPAQRRCLADARRVVRDGGLLVVETIVFPEIEERTQGVDARIIEEDRVVLTASRLDPAARSIVGQHIEITGSGIRLRPWRLHYLLPAELDQLAEETGWVLRDRSESWNGEPFTAHSEHQVVVYRAGPAR